MGERLDRLAFGLLKPINPYTQLIIGIFTTLWGIWLILPNFSVFGTAPLFSKMAQFAPEWAWGTWATVCGVFIVSAVLKGYYKFLLNTVAFACWNWWTVSLMMWWGDWNNTGGLTYSFIAVLCSYCFLNLKFNYVKTGGKPPIF